MGRTASVSQHLARSPTSPSASRWAFETGLIERLYLLDEGITALLVEQALADVGRSLFNFAPSENAPLVALGASLLDSPS